MKTYAESYSQEADARRGKRGDSCSARAVVRLSMGSLRSEGKADRSNGLSTGHEIKVRERYLHAPPPGAGETTSRLLRR